MSTSHLYGHGKTPRQLLLMLSWLLRPNRRQIVVFDGGNWGRVGRLQTRMWNVVADFFQHRQTGIHPMDTGPARVATPSRIATVSSPANVHPVAVAPAPTIAAAAPNVTRRIRSRPTCTGAATVRAASATPSAAALVARDYQRSPQARGPHMRRVPRTRTQPTAQLRRWHFGHRPITRGSERHFHAGDGAGGSAVFSEGIASR